MNYGIKKHLGKFGKSKVNFWHNKNVFITGHTGFKGSWLSIWLINLGANVYGYSLKPKKQSLFNNLELKNKLKKNIYGDIRDFNYLKKTIKNSKPEIVFHLAAQPLVIDSYHKPLETFDTNILGTANLLEACRNEWRIKSIVCITTDKCYKNKEWIYGYREVDELGGHDPYSSSKACAELVTSSYVNSFLKNKINVATVRAGNVIGGGDWSANRIVPDIIKSYNLNKKLIVRNPNATRPWQHVLEPLSGYIKLARLLYKNKKYTGPWNFGPNIEDNMTVNDVVKIFQKEFSFSKKFKVKLLKKQQKMHEANLLMLDISKSKKFLNWKPKWNCNYAVKKIVEWNKFYLQKKASEITLKQIKEYNGSL